MKKKKKALWEKTCDFKNTKGLILLNSKYDGLNGDIFNYGLNYRFFKGIQSNFLYLPWYM